MTAQIDLLAPEVKVDGVSLSVAAQNALIGVRVELGLCLVGRATLRFADPGYSLSATTKFALGADVVVSVPAKGTLMSGQVTGVSLEQSQRDNPELVVIVDELGYRLARGVKPATYLKMTYTDVLKKLATAFGLTADVAASGAMGEVNEYLLQTGSGLAFVDRIARRTGSVWWIDDRKLVVKAAGTSVGDMKVGLGEELIEFSVRASGLGPSGVSVTGWDQQNQSAILGTGSATSSATASFVLRNANASSLSGGSAVSTVDGTPNSQAEAGHLASALYDEVQSGAAVARGTCLVQPGLRPAMLLNVTSAGPASGEYYVSEVEHIYSTRGFHTRFVAGPRRPIGLVDTLGPGVSDPGFAISGLVIGVVTDNADDKNYGRVKVKFTALDGEVESAQARVVSLGAGSSRGAVFQPEVGDEVLVGFEYSDSRRPVVIGGLYSPKNTLPEASKLLSGGGEVDYRRITSRRGHILEFADGSAANEQHLLLKLGTAEHKLRLGADAFDIEVAQGKPVTIKAGSAKFAITEAGDVTIEGNNVTIKAKAAVQIEGTSEVTVKSSAKAAIQGAILDIKAQGTATVDGGGMLALKAGMVQLN